MVREEWALVERGAEWMEKGGMSKEGQTEGGQSVRGPLSLTRAWIGRLHWSAVLGRSSRQLRTKPPDPCLQCYTASEFSAEDNI